MPRIAGEQFVDDLHHVFFKPLERDSDVFLKFIRTARARSVQVFDVKATYGSPGYSGESTIYGHRFHTFELIEEPGGKVKGFTDTPNREYVTNDGSRSHSGWREIFDVASYDVELPFAGCAPVVRINGTLY